MNKPRRGKTDQTKRRQGVGSGRIPVRGASKPGGSKASPGKARPGKTSASKTGASKASARKTGGKASVRSREPVEAPRSRASLADLAETRELAVAAMEAALDKRALEPILIDVSQMGSYTDFIGIVSGRSDRQVDAIADSVCLALKARGRLPLGREGEGTGRWTLLDFGAFVLHVFYHPVREFYDLESLWIEAPRVKIQVPPEASLAQPDALYGAL